MSTVLTVRTGYSVTAALQRTAFVALLAAGAIVPRTRLAGFPVVFHPWSLLPFCGLVLVALVDVRRPLTLPHLDLVVVLSLVVALATTGAQRPWSMLLLYPQLGYLAARMLLVARRHGPPLHGLRVQLPAGWLAAGVLVLVGVHVAWEVPLWTYMDIAADSVNGALRILHGQALYVGQGAGQATYGPANFLAYVPFAALISDGQTAARLATIEFTMLTAVLLLALGRRERGTQAGLALAFCWLAFPFTLYEDSTALNDSLVAAALVATLLCLDRPRARGATAALATWTKLAPLALVPMLALRRDRRDAIGFAAAFAATTVLLFVPAFAHSTPSSFLSQSFGFQASRTQQSTLWSAMGQSWAQHAHWLLAVSAVLHALAVAAAVLAILFAPRMGLRRDLPGVAAACAGLLLLVEIALNSFAFSYVLWFAPFVLVALILGAPPEGAVGAPHAAAPARTARPGLPRAV